MEAGEGARSEVELEHEPALRLLWNVESTIRKQADIIWVRGRVIENVHDDEALLERILDDVLEEVERESGGQENKEGAQPAFVQVRRKTEGAANACGVRPAAVQDC